MQRTMAIARMALGGAFLTVPIAAGIEAGVDSYKEINTISVLEAIVVSPSKTEITRRRLDALLSTTPIREPNIEKVYLKEDNSPEGRRLTRLKSLLSRQHDVDRLFGDSVLIYANINEPFIPPLMQEYQRCSRRLGRANCNEAYEAAYQEYTEFLSLDIKKKALPLFIDLHRDYLTKLEEGSGMPKEITASVHGVESNFWTFLGHYNAFNVFVSQYVTNPTGSRRSRTALTQLIALLDEYPASRNDLSVLNIMSSRSGAIWYPQFMPASISPYAVGDISNPYIALASTDNYLRMNYSGNLEDMVFSYNHSRRFYVRAVIELAESTSWTSSERIAIARKTSEEIKIAEETLNK